MHLPNLTLTFYGLTIGPIHTSLCELYLAKDWDFHYFIYISQLSHFPSTHQLTKSEFPFEF